MSICKVAVDEKVADQARTELYTSNAQKIAEARAADRPFADLADTVPAILDAAKKSFADRFEFSYLGKGVTWSRPAYIVKASGGYAPPPISGGMAFIGILFLGPSTPSRLRPGQALIWQPGRPPPPDGIDSIDLAADTIVVRFSVFAT